MRFLSPWWQSFNRPSTTMKNPARETLSFYRRVWIALMLVTLCLLALLLRLFVLQVLKQPSFTTLSERNHIKMQAIAAKRGLIFDREHRLIAYNRPVHSLEVMPSLVDSLDALLETLAQHVEGLEQQRADLLPRLKTHPHQTHVIKTKLSDREIATLAEIQHQQPGVRIEARLVRHYPFQEADAHLLGYVGRVQEHERRHLDKTLYAGTTHIGKTGVEQTFEKQLHGTPGAEKIETNARGRSVRTIERRPPKDGHDLILTIDQQLQSTAYEALLGHKGAVVALQPQSGDILALVSTPSFDPNAFVLGLSPAAYRQLQNPSKPLFNRATRGQYPPASTIKPLLALAALEEGVITAQSRIHDPGYYQLPGDSRAYRDWKKSGHGWVALNRAISESCDTYFYQLGHLMGIDLMHRALQDFGLGAPTSQELGQEATGLVPNAAWKKQHKQLPWYPGETVITAIGQGFVLATPVQLAQASATLANRGDIPTLHLLKRDPPWSPKHHVDIAPNHWDAVIDAMINATEQPQGTAHKLHGHGYRVAGKTGTAQVIGIGQGASYQRHSLDDHLRDHSLFIGFAPAEQPTIALAVIIENEGARSVDIAGQLFDCYLKQQHCATLASHPTF